MKKILCFIFAFVLIIIMSACSGDNNTQYQGYDEIKENSEPIVSKDEENSDVKELKYPTIEEYMSAIKKDFGEEFITDEKKEGSKYQFKLATADVSVILEDDETVRNCSVIFQAPPGNEASLISDLTVIGIRLMIPLCNYVENVTYDAEECYNIVAEKIITEFKNSNGGSFDLTYYFGQCGFSESLIKLGSIDTYMITTGYKK